jgi:hypothetical protein
MLIKRLEDAGPTVAIPELGSLIKSWCRTAGPAFRCRNSIFHGVTIKMGNVAWFGSNPLWEGELRNRPFSDFHADEHTLNLLQAAFGVLFRSIITIERAAHGEASENAASELIPPLRQAWSVVIELERLAAAVNHEKY